MGNPAGREWLQTRLEEPERVPFGERQRKPGTERRGKENEEEEAEDRKSGGEEKGERESERETASGPGRKKGESREGHAYTSDFARARGHGGQACVCRGLEVLSTTVASITTIATTIAAAASSTSRLFVHESSVYLVPFRDRVPVAGFPFFSSIFASASRSANERAGYAETRRPREKRTRGPVSAVENRGTSRASKRLWRTRVSV